MGLGQEFATVLQAARLGAEWAWTALYRDLSPDVLRYLRAHGAPEPEDLLGDAFVRVVKTLPSFEGTEPQFRAWMFTIARNLLHDQWRRSGRSPVEYRPAEMLPECADPHGVDEIIERREAYGRVSATLARLTPDQRDVIFLRIIAGLTIDEVATMLGKQPGTVKSLQRRGLDSIRRSVSAEAVSQ